MNIKIVAALVGFLILTGGCGKRNQRFQGEQIASGRGPQKGTITYVSNDGTVTVPIFDHEVVLPNIGEVTFTSSQEPELKRTYDLNKETLFKRSGISFFTVGSQFALEKIQIKKTQEIPDGALLLAAYKINAEDVKIKLNDDVVGSLKLRKRIIIGKYPWETGRREDTPADRDDETELELKAKTNFLQNEIYFYVQAAPSELKKLKYNLTSSFSNQPLPDFNYPLCNEIHIPKFSPSNPQVDIGENVKCDYTKGTCEVPNEIGMRFTNVPIAQVLKEDAVCLKKINLGPYTQTEELGLVFDFTKFKKSVEVIPSSASNAADTSLLNQTIVFPEANFMFP